MKKITLLVSAALIAVTGMAQVQVNNDAFIYSKGTDIFITQELVLRDAPVITTTSTTDETTGGSGLYLRDEAQLIQSDDVVNSGNGFISVFQEGAAGNFTYNYWSSPVYDPSTSGGPRGFVRTQLYFPRLTSGFTSISNTDTDLVIDAQKAQFLPTGQRDGTTDEQDPMTSTVVEPLKVASRWLYSYNSFILGEGGGGYSGWTDIFDDTDVVRAGYGFTMKGVSGAGPNIINDGALPGQRYDFRGIPNNGDIEVGVNSGDFSLVGNPYPSALDLKQFMFENQGTSGNRLIDGQLYFWDSQPTSHLLVEYEGGYGTYSPDLGNPSSDGFYVDAVFRRYDEQGNEVGVVTGGSGGLSPPVGMGGTRATRRYAAVGQGFVIQRSIVDDPLTTTITEGEFAASSGTGAVMFRNSQRAFVREDVATDGTSIFKSAPGNNSDQTANVASVNVRPAMSFEVLVDGQYSRNMIVAFGDDASTDWDWGMDASNSANKVSDDAYMMIEGRESIIQIMPFSEDETSIPINLLSSKEGTTFEIQINGLENFSPNQALIFDKETNTYHDILNDAFTVQANQGEIADRYEIVFQDKSTLSNDDEILATETFNIFQNNDRSLLTVLNPASKDVANISVYDLAGRLVAQQNPKDANQEFTFNTSAYSAGIYIVKVSTRNDEEMATKVSVSN